MAGHLGGLDDPAFEELREAYARGDLVLFVGAGLSAAAGLPSWGRLVELLMERAKKRGAAPAALEEIGDLAGKRQLIDALSALKAALGAQEFCAAIERLLDDRAMEVPDVGRAVGELAPGLRALLTTNIDRLLERALGGQWPEVSRATGDLAQRARVIVKLHGTLYDRSTWVFTREDYDRAMYAEPKMAAAFSAMFHARTLLFVGYGLADDDFDQVLARVRAVSGDQAPRHFALVAGESVTPYRRDKVEKAGLRVIGYENPDGRHGEVARVLRALAGGGGGGGGATTVTSVVGEGERECPFPGLSFFEEERARYFFGRETEVTEAVLALGDTASGHRRWLQVEGPSGAGKSSLARAGVVPKVRAGWVAGGPRDWRVAVVRPGQDPIMSLAQGVRAALLDRVGEGLSLDDLLSRFLGSEAALKTFVREYVLEGTGFLLVIDQLEEAFTLAGGDKVGLVKVLRWAAGGSGEGQGGAALYGDDHPKRFRGAVWGSAGVGAYPECGGCTVPPEADEPAGVAGGGGGAGQAGRVGVGSGVGR